MVRIHFHGIAASKPMVSGARCHQEVVLSFLVRVSVSAALVCPQCEDMSESQHIICTFTFTSYQEICQIRFWFRSREVSNLNFEVYLPLLHFGQLAVSPSQLETASSLLLENSILSVLHLEFYFFANKPDIFSLNYVDLFHFEVKLAGNNC